MGGLTSIPGFKVGHAQDFDAITGCTVILCPPGTVGGIDQRGGSPRNAGNRSASPDAPGKPG